MIDVDIQRLIPAFILGDRNGYAAAKALEKGLKMFCQIMKDGIDNAINVEKMPEWRLDEMAWELDCLYDYGANIENKRAWIRDAVPLYASYGTVEAVCLYLSGYFADVEAEENWQYGGEPYHFRVTVGGEWTDAKEQWAKRAIADTKNVRSVLDDLSIGSSAVIKISGQTQWWRILYEMTTGDTLTGTMPQDATIGRIVEGILSASTEAAGFRYPYELTGTIPQENMVSAQGSAMATVMSDGAGTIFPYPQTTGDALTGTMPQESAIGRIVEGLLSANTEAAGFRYPYEIAGTIPQENMVSAQGSAMATALSDGAGTVFSYPQTSGNTFCGENDL